jgi:hypothetical protein
VNRRLLALVGLALLAAASLAVGASGAWFHSQSDSYMVVQAAPKRDWLNIYSQGTDPFGDTGYATQVVTSLPAATGMDADIDVYFRIPASGTYTLRRVVKVRTPSAFPQAGVADVTVAVAVTADEATGKQPIKRFGLDAWGVAPTWTHSVTGWGTDVQRQLNLELRFPGNSIPPGDYVPHVVLTLTYSGFTTTYYQYEIPIRIRYR